MPPAPTFLQAFLRGLVLRLVVLFGGALARRAAFLRARIATRGPTHRHHRARTAELARLERVRAVLADPTLFDDPRMIGCAAEAARVRNDVGRRAHARQNFGVSPFFTLPAARPAPSPGREPPDCRSTPAIVAS